MADNISNTITSVGSVYHSLEAVLDVLEKPEFRDFPEVQQLLYIFHSRRERCKGIFEPAVLATDKQFPFIVLEGIDGTGKTTLTQRLSTSLSVARNPPPCLLELRKKFDSHPTPLKRAFYALGNYVAAEEVKMLRREKPVVMDRFWHSTAAYAMACEVRERQGAVALPPEGHPVYTWPADLLQPDVVFLLHVAEEMRSARLARRETATPEELFLNHDHVFRENLVAAYKRMQNPAAVELDNSYRSIEDVVAEVKATIKHLNDQ